MKVTILPIITDTFGIGSKILIKRLKEVQIRTLFKAEKRIIETFYHLIPVTFVKSKNYHYFYYGEN